MKGFDFMKKMTFEQFQWCYLRALYSGVDMQCVWWTDEGDQVIMNWHPYTAELHSNLAWEADEFQLTIEEVMYAYEDVLYEASRSAYEEYLERCE